MGSGVSSQQRSEAEGLVATLRNSTDDKKRVEALSKIYEATNSDVNKVLLLVPELGLLPELKRIIRDRSGIEQEWAVAVLCQVGINDNNKVMLSSRDLGLMPLIMQNVTKYENCFTIMTNIMLRPENHDYLLSKEVGIMDHVRNFLDNFDPNNIAKDEKYLKIYSNVSACLKNENLELFLSYCPIEAMVKRMLISSTSIICNNNGYGYWILNFMNRISYHPLAAARLKELRAVPFITDLMSSTGIAGLKATIAVSNMIGKDEASNHSQSMIQNQPEKFALLLKLFKATLMKDVGPEAEDCKKLHGYLFGMIKMRNICGAIRTLTISDTNKPLMLKTNVVELLIRTLRLFTENALQLNILVNNMDQTAGGGGEDHETAEVAIEALLQLSFNYEMDEKLREVYTHACEYDVIQIFSDCFADRRNKLSSEAKRNAASLLKRLRLETPTSAAYVEPPMAMAQVVGAVNRPTKHIMLSYSWAVNKHLVIKVGQRLRELGHEVWRDEEGSSLVGPMQGDTDEKMAAAIESSHTVIIFVSPQYKESGNCRMEAKYSKQRQLVSPLKILYVMMCENYHTRSNPPVDGWLALNIGTDLWYPLWHESMLMTTTQAISDLIYQSGGALTAAPVAVSPTRQQSQPVSTTSATAGGVNVDAAWDILNDAGSSNEPGELEARINAIGIGEKNDLLLLEDSELYSLVDLMKPLKQRKFLAALDKKAR